MRIQGCCAGVPGTKCHGIIWINHKTIIVFIFDKNNHEFFAKAVLLLHGRFGLMFKNVRVHLVDLKGGSLFKKIIRATSKDLPVFKNKGNKTVFNYFEENIKSN